MKIKEILQEWAGYSSKYVSKEFTKKNIKNNLVINLQCTFDDGATIIQKSHQMIFDEDKVVGSDQLAIGFNKLDDTLSDELTNYINDSWTSVNEVSEMPEGDVKLDLAYRYLTIVAKEDGHEYHNTYIFTSGVFNGKEFLSDREEVNFEKIKGNLRLDAWRESI